MNPQNASEPGGADIQARIAKIDPPSRRSSHVSSTRTWRDGSRTARRWDTELLAWAALCVGGGAIASILLRTLIPTTAGSLMSALAMWAGMAAPVVLAFRRSRPRGLLRFRWVDVLYAIVLGGALRIIQGWFAVAAGDSGAFPTYPLVDGRLPDLWWLTSLVGPVAIAPLLEEFLFRGVVLVAVFRLARRGLDGGALALVASTAAFVALHAISGMASWAEPVSLTFVGLTCALLVLLTGRIWGAVLTHVVFNASAVGLALIGTMLA
ncbi:CPBP family intramembrane glutamic endopeptidase [Microbacterium rhizophilus]|uniref:CPBP family intramembrane glutamic endopeptidase n=1 Tax=Microbacterium rhizophilus TaxID=3138934 RepID=UPI0031ED146B